MLGSEFGINAKLAKSKCLAPIRSNRCAKENKLVFQVSEHLYAKCHYVSITPLDFISYIFFSRRILRVRGCHVVTSPLSIDAFGIKPCKGEFLGDLTCHSLYVKSNVCPCFSIALHTDYFLNLSPTRFLNEIEVLKCKVKDLDNEYTNEVIKISLSIVEELTRLISDSAIMCLEERGCDASFIKENRRGFIRAMYAMHKEGFGRYIEVIDRVAGIELSLSRLLKSIRENKSAEKISSDRSNVTKFISKLVIFSMAGNTDVYIIQDIILFLEKGWMPVLLFNARKYAYCLYNGSFIPSKM